MEQTTPGSISLSPSVSESLSPSASVSPSVSISLSPSPSPSPSPSASISPSQPAGSGLYSKAGVVSLPTTKSSLDILYGEEDETNVSTDDGVRVPIMGSDTLVWDFLAQETGDEIYLDDNHPFTADEMYIEQKDCYLEHQYRILNNNNKDIIKVLINLQALIAPTTYPVYLQVWNVLSGVWEALTSNNTASANTDFDLEDTIDTNQANYYDGYEVAFRVHQFATYLERTLSVDLVQVCWKIVYDAKYADKGTTFTDKYSDKNTPFQDKYSDKATAFQDKYSDKATTYQDKFTDKGTTYVKKYTSKKCT